MDKTELILQHRDFLFRYLKRRFRYIRLDDIDDIVQVALIKACQKIDGMENRSTIKTWVTKIAINDALDFLRKNKKCDLLLSECNMEESESCDLIDNFNNYNPIETYTNNHASNQIINSKLEIVKKSNPLAYETLMAYLILDDYKKVQEAQNLTIGTVKSRLNRARSIIRKNISDSELALISV